MNKYDLPKELSLENQNDIPILTLHHPVGIARIALQGAQLLSWKPKGKEEIFWLSKIEPFIQGIAIRGGVPICYPWFGTQKQPAHGTARLRLWFLSNYDISDDKVSLTFSLFSAQNIIEAKVIMIFSEKCQIIFTHYGQESAQVALHSYFNVSEIEQIEIQNLPTTRINKLTNMQEDNQPAILKINKAIDSIYPFTSNNTIIVDPIWNRKIEIIHHDTSEIVIWNPWENTPSAMQSQDYKNMVCLESARLSKVLSFGETIAVEIMV